MGVLANKYMSLFLIVLLGMGLRSYGLFERPLWYDEVFSIYVSDPLHSLSTVFNLTVKDVHPPLYQVLLWLVHKVFGFGEHTGRVFSFVLGVAVIPSMYLLGRYFFNDYVGLLAALLTSVNFIFVAKAQEARSYSLLVFLVIWSFLTLSNMIDKRSLGAVITYTAVATMLVNTHYFGFLPVMTQFILLLYFSTRSGFDKKLFVSSLVAGLIILSSVAPIAYYIVQSLGRTGTWIPDLTADFVVEAFVIQFGDTCVAIVSVFFIMLGLGVLLRSEDKSDRLKILLLWYFLGFSVAYIRSVFFTTVLSFKNTIIFVPVLIVLVSYGFSLVRDSFSRWVLLIFFCVMSITYFVSGPDYSKLQVVQDLRSPLIKISNENPGWPIYGGEIYSYYLRILDLPIQVEPYEVLEAKIVAHTVSPCFYVLDERWWPDHQKHLDIELVERTSFENISLSVFRTKGGADCKLTRGAPLL
jgi:uncharacterized membrane protein